jgi:hypothetical protein
MKLSSVASLEAETRTALGGRLSVLELELSGVELERHKESSSKLHGSDLLKISLKWRRLARKCQALCDAKATSTQHDVSLRPRSSPIVAARRFELRESAHGLQRVMARRAVGEPPFSVNGCCDAAQPDG